MANPRCGVVTGLIYREELERFEGTVSNRSEEDRVVEMRLLPRKI